MARVGMSGKIRDYFLREGNRNVVLLVCYLALQLLVLASVTDHFFSGINFRNLMRQTAELGMITLPFAMLILTGNIDLSISAIIGVCAISLAQMLKHGMPISVSLLLTLLIGAAIGAINGFFVAKLKLAGIVATIGTQVMFRGICYILTGGRPVSGLPRAFTSVSRWNVWGAPMTFIIMLAMFGVGLWFMKYTSFGIKLHAIGYNSRASIFSGVHSDRIKFLLYVFSGAVGAVAGTFMLTRFASAESAFGFGYDTDALTSVLVGGMSIGGGSGNLLGALLGVLTIGSLRNGLNHLEISSLYQQIVLGVLIVVSAAKWKRQKL